ncbi:protein kinase domain-containing protein, partial [Synechococcus sp. RedBA-s]|uniref:protein kinase domain-containing protein n=1 Tax=Synechococcus sp. RedBA-s TaxID=2823741 RepID=UPI0020CF8129
MTWILPEGASLDLEGISSPLQVLRGLGGGSQGQVFEVEVAGERLALKWYLPACIARDPHLKRRLGESIHATAPSEAFLWPLALVTPGPGALPLLRLTEPGFGYLMQLRPPGFVGAHEHVGGHLAIGLLQVLRAGFFLAEAFHSLHLKGLCYKDISLGNLFLEPSSGRILICDNDNVDVDGRDLGSVLGTPGFMAPEILMGRARPGANSDLFSLAVLIFRLLTRHDPLRGRRELAIHCLDEPARRRLYGEDPLFIFDPVDASNRPDPIEHAAALITWPIYPEPIQRLFEQTFCAGMQDPQRRALTGQWMAALAAALDQRQLCGSCGQETFPAPSEPAPLCWSCG